MNKEFKRRTFFKSTQQDALITGTLFALIWIIVGEILDIAEVTLLPSSWIAETTITKYSSVLIWWVDFAINAIGGITLACIFTFAMSKFRCFITPEGIIHVKWNNGYYNRINIPITQIIELTLEPQKFVWGIYDNVRISYTDKKGKKRSTTLFLQEPQKFINEVEKIRKSSK